MESLFVKTTLMNEETIDWRAVAKSFYLACGGMDGCGDIDDVDALCSRYAKHFEEEDADE